MCVCVCVCVFECLIEYGWHECLYVGLQLVFLSFYLRLSVTVVCCPEISVMASGKLCGITSAYTAEKNFSCNLSYQLRGATTLVCLVSGKWSESTPSCHNEGNATDIKNSVMVTD